MFSAAFTVSSIPVLLVSIALLLFSSCTFVAFRVISTTSVLRRMYGAFRPRRPQSFSLAHHALLFTYVYNSMCVFYQTAPFVDVCPPVACLDRFFHRAFFPRPNVFFFGCPAWVITEQYHPGFPCLPRFRDLSIFFFSFWVVGNCFANERILDSSPRFNFSAG